MGIHGMIGAWDEGSVGMEGQGGCEGSMGTRGVMAVIGS